MIKKIGVVLAIAAQLASADVFQWTDSNGQVHYSDTAPKDKNKTKNLVLRSTSSLPNITTIQHVEPTETAPTEQRGPNVIHITESNGASNCLSQKLGSIDRNDALDAWQDNEWKKCHGMKLQ